MHITTTTTNNHHRDNNDNEFFPGSTRFGLRFSEASLLGPVRFDSFPCPFPAGSGIKWFDSVRPVRLGFLFLPVSSLWGFSDPPWLNDLNVRVYHTSTLDSHVRDREECLAPGVSNMLITPTRRLYIYI